MPPALALPTQNRHRAQPAPVAGSDGMFAPLMDGMRARRAAVGAVMATAALAAAGCGGGERQDADEPKGSFKVDVVEASFPADQQVAQRSTMRVRVRNADTKEIPNVALTVETQSRQPGGAPSAFGQSVDDPRLADNERPVWIVDSGPEGGDTAYTNTWALGRLRPGQTRTFEWKVTAVEPGSYTIDYEVAPGLDGRAKLASGSKRGGSFKVRISDDPVDARVGDNGEVIREREGTDKEISQSGAVKDSGE